MRMVVWPWLCEAASGAPLGNQVLSYVRSRAAPRAITLRLPKLNCELMTHQSFLRLPCKEIYDIGSVSGPGPCPTA